MGRGTCSTFCVFCFLFVVFGQFTTNQFGLQQNIFLRMDMFLVCLIMVHGVCLDLGGRWMYGTAEACEAVYMRDRHVFFLFCFFCALGEPNEEMRMTAKAVVLLITC